MPPQTRSTAALCDMTRSLIFTRCHPIICRSKNEVTEFHEIERDVLDELEFGSKLDFHFVKMLEDERCLHMLEIQRQIAVQDSCGFFVDLLAHAEESEAVGSRLACFIMPFHNLRASLVPPICHRQITKLDAESLFSVFVLLEWY